MAKYFYEYFTTFVRKESKANTQRMVDRRYGRIHKPSKLIVYKKQGPQIPGFKEKFGTEYTVVKRRVK